MPSNQKQIIKQAKFIYSPLGKVLEKQTKTIEEQGRKEVDVITNLNKRLATLTNKDDYKDNHKEIFQELVKERLDEIIELTDEINQNDSTYYFKGNTFRNKFDDFNNGIELF